MDFNTTCTSVVTAPDTPHTRTTNHQRYQPSNIWAPTPARPPSQHEALSIVAGIIGKSRDISLLGRRQCYTQTQVSSTSSSAAQKLPALPPPTVVGATEIYVSWRCAPPPTRGAEATDPQV